MESRQYDCSRVENVVAAVGLLETACVFQLSNSSVTVAPHPEGGAITSRRTLGLVSVCAGWLESESRAWKFDAPTVVGAPLIVPSSPSVNPFGSAPLAIDQWIGARPPLELSV